MKLHEDKFEFDISKRIDTVGIFGNPRWKVGCGQFCRNNEKNMKANNGKMTDVQRAVLRDGGSSPADNFVQNCTLLPRRKFSEAATSQSRSL